MRVSSFSEREKKKWVPTRWLKHPCRSQPLSASVRQARGDPSMMGGWIQCAACSMGRVHSHRPSTFCLGAPIRLPILHQEADQVVRLSSYLLVPGWLISLMASLLHIPPTVPSSHSFLSLPHDRHCCRLGLVIRSSSSFLHIRFFTFFLGLTHFGIHSCPSLIQTTRLQDPYMPL